MNSIVTRLIDVAIHISLVLTFSPLLLGVVNKVKAWFAGRNGPPLLQPYFDLSKLFRKGSVFSTTTTWVFRAGPVVGLATSGLAAMLLPLGGHPAPIAFAGDLVLFAYLFGLGRFFTVAAALDTGSAFEGMGGAREATFACLAEPALFLSLLVFVHGSGSLSLSSMLGSAVGELWAEVPASLVLVLAALFLVLLVESSRVPFDDPNTHLELTMIHEVMVLDHSGPAFGMISYGAAIKLFVLGAIVARVALPFDTGSSFGDWGVFVGSMLAIAVVIGVIESVIARARLTQIPKLLVGACVLSSFGIAMMAR
ncbi:MAG: NADH-quinone oxidoreductase subunit H [Deltaproteobacteria bacterium]|nr:NADH-quinone oxidoreductase subunit H [Deltaproteobacteria bacterium]